MNAKKGKLNYYYKEIKRNTKQKKAQKHRRFKNTLKKGTKKCK